MDHSGSRELVDVLRRFRRKTRTGHAFPDPRPPASNPQSPTPSTQHPTPNAQPPSLAPGCAYGVQSRQILDDLKRDVDEVKLRLNGLIFLVVGAVVVDVVMRLVR